MARRSRRRRGRRARPSNEQPKNALIPDITSADEAVYEDLFKELKLEEHYLNHDMAIIESRLPSNQHRIYLWWVIRRRRQLEQARTRPAEIIRLIQTTGFDRHASRVSLGRLIYDAASSFVADEDHFVPIGSRNRHRFALRPLRELENVLWEDGDYPSSTWITRADLATNLEFAVRERTYEQLWCPAPESGLPQSRYGRCSGQGLLRPSSPGPADDVVDDDLEQDDQVPPSLVTTLVTVDKHAPLDHAFFHLGKLCVSAPAPAPAAPAAPAPPTTGADKPGARWAETEYIIAVDTEDRSVWLIYDAWHFDDGSWEPDSYNTDGLDPDGAPPTHGRFRPEHEPDWARLKGYDDRRRVMAKLADDARTWPLGSYDAPFSVGPAALPDRSIPVFSSVWLDRDQKLVVPIE